MALNSSNRCDGCHGVVSNIGGRRHTIERLTTIHNETCPGRHRAKGPK